MVAEIANSHHEQWDGSGYPQGLKRDQIPMSAQILGIADIYDALYSERAYKRPFSQQKTFQILTAGDDLLDPAKHFSPNLLGIFKQHHGEFDQIRKRLEDESKSRAGRTTCDIAVAW